MINKIGPFTTEDLVRMPVEYLDEPKIYTTLGGAFVFTGDDFIALSEPKGNDAITKMTVDAETVNFHSDGETVKVSGMTIKDVARHKDYVKLEKRVAKLENAMDSVKGLGGRHFGIDWRGI